MVRRRGEDWTVRLPSAGEDYHLFCIICEDLMVVFIRNQTKYTQGKNSELRAILEKARQRTEVRREAGLGEESRGDTGDISTV